MDDLDEGVATVVATLRALLSASGALRVVAALDGPDGRVPLIVDYTAAGELEIAAGDEIRIVDPDTCAGTAVPLPDMRALHGLEFDPGAGTLAAPIGALGAVGDALRAAARAFGARSVVGATFATADPEAPLFLAARVGEPLVVSVGEDEFELAE